VGRDTYSQLELFGEASLGTASGLASQSDQARAHGFVRGYAVKAARTHNGECVAL
jgi:hypothetical protein